MALTRREIKRRYTLRHPDRVLAQARAGRKTPHTRFALAKGRAKQRGILWTLTLEEFVSFIGKPCYFCGGPRMQISGLDRRDNAFGYVSGNVLPCCWVCNTRKGGLEMAGFRYPRTLELMEELGSKGLLTQNVRNPR